jgi:hypothetical protein
MLVVENAIIINGNDCVAAKGNTTNLLVKDVTCHQSNGMTIGSVGQYPNMSDYDVNITFEDVRCLNCMDGAYIKTWQGVSASKDSNGDVGGGGRGLIKNITSRNFEMQNGGLRIQISRYFLHRVKQQILQHFQDLVLAPVQMSPFKRCIYAASTALAVFLCMEQIAKRSFPVCKYYWPDKLWYPMQSRCTKQFQPGCVCKYYELA